MIKTVGFIGAGRMGGAIAERISRDPAWKVTIYDPSPTVRERFHETAARVAARAQDVFEGCAYVVSSLPLPEDVERLYSPSGVIDAIRSGTVVVDVSTIDPFTGRRVADAVQARGATFVAAPLGMGPRQAADGTLPLYLGAAPGAIQRADPLLNAISSSRYVIGDVEQAYTAKLAINYVSMSNLAVLLEGFGIGVAAGIDGDLLCKLMQDGGAKSFQSDVRLPWILAEDFAPRFGIGLAQKDMRLAIDIAARYHAAAATGAAALQHFSAAQRKGLAAADIGALWQIVNDRVQVPPAERRSAASK
ncbi:MAG: NAD(P)-dependent oxidoreductase [Candidatus Velthaea sp.]